MISIALAAYNGSKYIREQLDSILVQTYQDFELIVCDDCSTDNTLQILTEYANKDNRIKIFENEKNLGFKKNFEKAISLCSGEYIALSDQDDIWIENHLEVLLREIKQYDAVCGDSELIDSCGNSLGIKFMDYVVNFHYADINYIYLELLRGNKFQGATMLLRTDFVKKCIPVPESLDYHDWWFCCCSCMENGFKAVFNVVTKYRMHNDSITNSKEKTPFERVVIDNLNFLFNKELGKKQKVYAAELKNKYGLKNPDFIQIYNFLFQPKIKRLSPKNISLIRKNYFSISGNKSYRFFFGSWFFWLFW